LFPAKKGDIWNQCRKSINHVGLNRVSNAAKRYRQLELEAPPPPAPPSRYAVELAEYKRKKEVEKQIKIESKRQLAAALLAARQTQLPRSNTDTDIPSAQERDV
jgi:hypothetical protein